MTSQYLHEALGLETDQTPFPWQLRLLAEFEASRIPSALDIPTGLGKTSVMALWLIARLSGAELPRRLVYVVDRRAVVDQATEVAIALRTLVDAHLELRARLGLGPNPLPISTLRGQHVDNKRWLEDPASAAIIVGTVDMVGSRLLFEGYGVSPKMRPYHAGLLGADTLVVLDEAHLVPPFERLLESIAHAEIGPVGDERSRLVPRFRMLPLSATGRARESGVFSLDGTDWQHPVAAQRLRASKSLSFVAPEQDETLPAALARHAFMVATREDTPKRCTIFCNKRDDAQKVQTELDRLTREARRVGRLRTEIEAPALLIGGRRAYEREQAAKQLRELGFLAADKTTRKFSSFLVATSAGEVGVDLDADHMVCDLVAWERMVQRLGRVNRRGKHLSEVLVVTPPRSKDVSEASRKSSDERSPKETRLLAEDECTAAAERVLRRLPAGDRGFDASPGALCRLRETASADAELAAWMETATTTSPLWPALTRPVLEAWSMTSLRENAGRPVVDPWLRGWVDEEPHTTVVFRQYLPIRTNGQLVSRRDVELFFEAAPPHGSELLEMETFRIVEWLIARVEKAVASDGKSPTRDSLSSSVAVAFVLSTSGVIERHLGVQDLVPRPDKKKLSERLHRELAGRTVIVDRRLGGLHLGLLDKEADVTPSCGDDEAQWLDGGEGAPMVGFAVDVVASETSPLDDSKWRERLRIVIDRSAQGDPTAELRVRRWGADAATEDDRSEGHLQTLSEHQAWAEECARSLADRLKLPAPYAAALAAAARLHDEGKRAKNWQRAFRAPRDGVAYAKTPGPILFSVLNGYRHELGSLPRVEADAEFRSMPDELRDLVLHLVAAHHGFARPAISVEGCDDTPPSLLEASAQEIALRFARLERAWGPWGLAWWESLLRAADQQASRANERLRDTGKWAVP